MDSPFPGLKQKVQKAIRQAVKREARVVAKRFRVPIKMVERDFKKYLDRYRITY